MENTEKTKTTGALEAEIIQLKIEIEKLTNENFELCALNNWYAERKCQTVKDKAKRKKRKKKLKDRLWAV